MIIPKRKWRYPLSIEREYAKLLVQLVQKKFEVIETFLPEMVGKVYKNRLDSIGDWLGNLVEKIKRKIEKISALPIVNKIFGKVDKHTKTEQAETFKSVFGAEIQQKTPQKFEMLKTIWTAENMTLIKSIDNQTMEKIQYTLSQKIISAANKEILLQDLTQEIKNIAKVSEKRAALIGADQVGKLNGRLVQYRQQSAGIEYFIWRTMGDRRVRPAHAAKNGVMYRWDSPVEKPGEAIRCRCVAQPYINEQSFKLLPKKDSYTELHKNDIIRSRLEYVMKENKIKGELVFPPPKIDYSDYPVDIEHARGGKHPHDVTETDARNFIKDAYFVIVKYNGNSYNYYGKYGAAFVRNDLKTIRTAFKREEFDDSLLKLIEVYENEQQR